jgi:hypothetical protein
LGIFILAEGIVEAVLEVIESGEFEGKEYFIVLSDLL